MMKCSEAKQYLWDYYDEACSPEQRQSLEAHLSGCGDCRASLDEWIALSQTAFRRHEVKAPAFLWTRVLAGIESQEREEKAAWWYQWRWMSRIATAMALLVSLGAGIVLYQATKDEGSLLDAILQGGEKSAQVTHLASAKTSKKGDDITTVAWLLGGSSWDQK
jgi:anti-sigma factor RsiW